MINQKKNILFIGGGIETLPGVHLAKSMGLNVVISDINPKAPCVKFADDFLLSDIYDIKNTLKKAKAFNKKKKINGVICMASDAPLTVATITYELGLPGIPIYSAKLVSDKLLMKDFFKKKGIPIPKYREIFELNDIKKAIDSFGLPLVIKPVDSRGARGVIIISKEKDIEWSYITSKSFSPKKKVLVEQYLSGPQLSTELIVVNGEVFTIGFSDRNYEFLKKYAPYIIENGGDLPSKLKKDEVKLIKDTFETTAKALKINNGVLKGDMVLSNKKPYIIEVAARLSGGYFCSHEIPYNTGVNFVKNAILLAIGEKVEKNNLKIKKNRPVSQRYLFPKPGKVLKIHVPKWIKREKNIVFFDLRIKVGDTIGEIKNHPSRAGVVIATGKDIKKARLLAERVVKEIIIKTKKII